MASPLTKQQIRQSDIPVYVVPDKPGGQRMSYNPNQGSVRSWQGNLKQGIDAIADFKKKNPVRSPFPQGAKTLESKKLDEGQRQFDLSLEEQKRQYDQDMAFRLSQAAKGAGGSGGGAADKNALTNAVLRGAIDKYFDLINNGVVTRDPLDSRGQVTHYSLDPDEAMRETTRMIYENLGNAGISISDASSVIKAFESAVDYKRPKEKEEPSYKQQYEDEYWKQRVAEGDFSMLP